MISIHAPVKGATPFKSSIVYALPLISIHAPVKGATICSTSSSKRSSDFNPRTREGCDSGTDPVYWGTTLISIHAPVKGATCYGSGVKWSVQNISIHAPVKGATLCKNLVVRARRYFNPRTREGCDPRMEQLIAPGQLISIHAPVKGATHRCRNRERTASYFNPRTREGCDPPALMTIFTPPLFQSTHP